jgi:hypothetical protein
MYPAALNKIPMVEYPNTSKIHPPSHTLNLLYLHVIRYLVALNDIHTALLDEIPDRYLIYVKCSEGNNRVFQLN